MICAVAGMTADANILINYARQAAQNYLLTYNEDIPGEQLVRRLCDLKQGYTQHGGPVLPLRPPLLATATATATSATSATSATATSAAMHRD